MPSVRRWLPAALIALVAVAASGTAAVPGSATAHLARAPIAPSTTAPISVQAYFNEPGGPWSADTIRDLERTAVEDVVDDLKYGGASYPVNVELSAFQFTDYHLASLLVEAAGLGANVEVLLDGGDRLLGCHGFVGCENSAYIELTALNQDNQTNPATWLRTCDGIGPANSEPEPDSGDGCIGQSRDHNKFLITSQGLSGSDDYSTDVIQTSSNSTGPSYNSALNNAIEIAGQPQVYDDYDQYFHRLAASYLSTGAPAIKKFDETWGFSVDTDSQPAGDIATWTFPQQASNDPAADLLRGVGLQRRCRTVDPIAGDPKHTRVEIAMSVVGGRPLLMAQLSRLAEAGCVVRLVYSRMSPRDHQKLAAGGVGLTRLCIADAQRPADPVEYVHSKYMIIEGADAGFGADERILYTGSDNWTNQGLLDTDDRMLQYVEPASDAPVAVAYEKNFTYLRQLAATGTPATVGCGTADD